jgi:L-amino acid N-acyltransferase YncA
MAKSPSISSISTDSNPHEGVEFHYVRSRKRPPSLPLRSNLLTADTAHDNSPGLSTPSFAAAVRFNLPTETTSPASNVSLLWPPGESGATFQKSNLLESKVLYSRGVSLPSETGSLVVSIGDKQHGPKAEENANDTGSSPSNDPEHMPGWTSPLDNEQTGERENVVAIFEKDSLDKPKRPATNGNTAKHTGQGTSHQGNGNLEIAPHCHKDEGRAPETEIIIRPLEDIKRWSIPYFRREDPELAAEIAAYQDRSDTTENVSQADTRSIASDASELVLDTVGQVEYTPSSLAQQAEWLEFVGQRPARRAEHYLPDLPVRMQISEWDEDCVTPGKDMYESVCWSMGHDVAANIDHWVKLNVDLKHKFIVDTSSTTFKSGTSRPSGMLQNCLTRPIDVLYEKWDPDFEPINWNDIPVLRPPEYKFLTPFQHRQCSELCRQIVLEPYKKLVAKVEQQRSKPPVDKPKQGAKKRKSTFPTGEPIEAQLNKPALVTREHFYVRPARRGDASQLCRIYNEWVDTSAVTTDVEHRDISYFQDAVVSLRDAELPFLVAAARSGQDLRQDQSGRLTRNQYVQQTHANPAREERILGFSSADQPRGFKGGIFQGLLEVELFTDPHRLRRGVGKVLLDRVLSFTIPFYHPHPGAEFVFDDSIDGVHYKFGYLASPHPIRKVLIELLWDAKDAQEVEWKKKMLEAKFGFYQAAYYANLGARDNRPINVTTMVRDTVVRATDENR